MVSSTRTALPALVLGFAASAGFAHDPAHDPQQHAREPGLGAARAWHDVRLGQTSRGTLLAVGADSVSVELEAGGTVAIPLADLAADELALAAGARGKVLALHAPQEPGPVAAPTDAPWQADSFAAFAPHVRTRWDERWLYVESDGLPHAPLEFRMMAGIRTWQQQVPLPQAYVGRNAWQVPLHPELASEPVSARTELRRGAIALAANGIPIFNALNNRGEDAFAIGELDEFGGHSGRADDYHYHVAPLALQTVLGPQRPIAFALDGLAIYGLFDPQAKAGGELACPLGATEALDELNGHACDVAEGRGLGGGTRSYHYHASRSYPYINGGMRGRVTVEGDQIVPQPRTEPLRPSLSALRGARITGFERTGERAWKLTYELAGRSQRVEYGLDASGSAHFEFVGPDGRSRSESYAPRARGGERRASAGAAQTLTLASPAVGADGALPVRFTCDGESLSPSFEWSGAPAETRSFALTLHHVPPEGGEHVYLVLWDIPPTVTRLAEAQRNLGVFGANTVNRRAEYAPPCSQGPGEKLYVATVYALSAAPSLPSDRAATRAELLAAIANSTLATAELELRYSRGGAQRDDRRGEPRERGGERRAEGGQREGGAFRTEVPAHALDIVLARPTECSVTVSVVAAAACEAFVEYGRPGDEQRRASSVVKLEPGRAGLIELEGLEPGSEYRYRVVTRAAPDSAAAPDAEHSFVTRRAAGTPFTFTITADSHLDENVAPDLYVQALANALADRPDFHVDLGDTFMTDKRRDFREAASQYAAQRYYFGLLCHSAPLFLALGNHDGEDGSYLARSDIAAWSYAMRTERFPPPLVGAASRGFYSGRTALVNGRGANYFAFEWGDALLLVLDPFWPATERPRGRGAAEGFDDASWSRTLGREQYDWLAATLAGSKAAHRFVFTHHLIGGRGKEARGGVESAPYFEWGGRNADGSEGFAARRPGWPMPIHELLRRNGVGVVFHGHDHLYVRSELDGVVYQCVPQPGNPLGGTRSAEEYGYRSGTILGSPGHLRVSVTAETARVEFVRAALPDAARGRRGDAEANRTVVHSYTVPARAPAPAGAK